MMSDKELLELAAKAAGYSCRIRTTKIGIEKFYINGHVWNPLDDDGDALRLAVELHINIEISNVDALIRTCFYIKGRGHGSFGEPYTIRPYAATRRAIVRAAAEIGKEKK